MIASPLPFKVLGTQIVLLTFVSWHVARPAFAQINSAGQADTEYHLAVNLKAKGHLAESRTHLLKLVHSPWGQKPANYMLLSDTYIEDLEAPNTRLAKAYLHDAIRIDPGYGPAYRNLAWLAKDNGRFEDCIELATKATTCKTPDMSALMSRSKAYHALHNLNAAMTDVDNYFKVEKNLNFRDYDYKASLQIQLGKIDDAIKTYESAKSLRGDWATLQIAHCLELQHKSSEAIAKVSSLIKKNPEDDEAYHIRAQLYFNAKNYNGAIADLTQAIKLTPTSSYYRERAKAYQALGQNTLARKDIDESEK
jgi:tetratricopeptide (TPR) repeat protein